MSGVLDASRMASALARIALEILERNSTVDETPNSAPTSCLGAQRLPIQSKLPQKVPMSEIVKITTGLVQLAGRLPESENLS
jgi:hypothetical protein